MTLFSWTLSSKNVPWSQWIAASGVALLFVQIGLVIGWSTPYVAQLTAEDSPLPLTSDEASWVTSLNNLGRLIGAIAGSTGARFLGGKTTTLIACIPAALYWVFIMPADSVEWLYVARLMGGTAMGMLYACYPIYIGEIASPEIRGALVSLGICGLTLGSLLMVIMGPALSIWTSAYICVVPSFVLIPLFVYLPESPHHLIRKDRVQEARASISWYHSRVDVDQELKDLTDFVSRSNAMSFWQELREFWSPRLRKATLLINILNVFTQMSGMGNVCFYMQSILTDSRVDVVNPEIVVIIAMTVGTVTSFFSMYIVDLAGRRILMTLSLILVSLSMAGLALGFLFIDLGFDSAWFQAFPISSVTLVQIAIYGGLLSVPNIVLSEVFPPSVKSVAALTSSIFLSIAAFVSAKSYQPLIDALGSQIVFWIYAITTIVAVPYVLVFMPETKGKSLQRIQIELMGS